MKPQSLQDAIKAAAMKKKTRIETGQWKEPKVKEVKVTAEDMKNSEKTTGGNRSGMFMPPAPPIDDVLRKELDMLKRQMLDLKASMSTSQGAAPAIVPPVVEKSGPSNEEVEDLRDQVRELKGVTNGLLGLPGEISSLRKSVKSLDDQQQQTSSPPHTGGGVDVDDFEELKNEVMSIRAAMRKQKGELVRELDGALSKLEKQETIIQEQQREIDALKSEVKAVSLKAIQAEKEAKKATSQASSVASTRPVQLEVPSSPKRVLATDASPTTSPVQRGLSLSPPETPKTMPPNNTDSDIDSESSDISPQRESPPQSTRYSEMENEDISDKPPQNHSLPSPEKPVDESDSDSDSDRPSRIVCQSPPQSPMKTTTPDSDLEIDDEAFQENTQREHRQHPRRFETQNAPSKVDYGNDEENDEGNGDIEIDVEDDEARQTEQNQQFARRGSLDSVQTWDTEDSKPRKKTISLLPHKSANIYEQQRKDTVLRKLMLKGKTTNMTVRKVHGKNLVFFSDRIYIPPELREKTLEFYWKKYKKQTPLIHLEKNCFWADMKADMRQFEADKRRYVKRR